MRSVAVMQPYLFPYIGYFQLISSCNTFVFLDDVRWIKNGWINRNKIWSRDHEDWLTVPVEKIHLTDRIFDVKIADPNYKLRLLAKLKHAYWDAPNLELVLDLVNNLKQTSSIMELVEDSLSKLMFLIFGNNHITQRSANITTVNTKAEGRVIHLCRYLNAANYVNMEGGKFLYSKENFAAEGIDLKFVTPNTPSYRIDNSGNPVPGHLSILDMLAYLDMEDVRTRVNDYDLS